MRDFFSQELNRLNGFSLTDALDILLITFINYKILMLIRGTRAWRIVFGGVVFIFALWLSFQAKLSALHWLLDRGAVLLPVAIVILLARVARPGTRPRRRRAAGTRWPNDASLRFKRLSAQVRRGAVRGWRAERVALGTAERAKTECTKHCSARFQAPARA